MKSQRMRKVGAYLAFGASLGGILAAAYTYIAGSVAQEGAKRMWAVSFRDDMYANSAQVYAQGINIIMKGRLGILASLATLILAVVVPRSESQKPAWVLLACSIFGLLFCGTALSANLIMPRPLTPV